MSDAEFGWVPSGRNLVHNPKPVDTTHMAIVAGTGTLATTTERSFSGQRSVRLTLDASSEFRWRAGVDDDADFAAIPDSSLVGMAVRVLGSYTGTVSIALRVLYTDGIENAHTFASNPAISATEFTRLGSTALLTTTPGKTVRNISLRVATSAASSATLYLGGLDVRLGEFPDTFIHGDGGSNYSWESVANNSPSVRAGYAPAPIFGRGGQIFPTVSLHVVNRQNQVQREITEHFLDGSVTYDLDADGHKGSCQISLNEPGLVDALADEYVRISLRVARADGSVSEGPIGMFILDPPKERWMGGHDEWSYAGKDMLSILSTFMFRGVVLTAVVDGEAVVEGSYGFVEGTSYRAALEDILINHLDFSPLQFSFSGAMPQAADEAIGWEAGTDALTIVSDILEGAGWRKPWVTPNGIITSAPAGTNPAVITPSLILTTGDNSYLRWPFEVDTDASEVGNRVRVVSAKDVTSMTRRTKRKKARKITKRSSVEVWRTNDDPSHPLSFSRLGRWIDIPDVTVPLVKDTAEAVQIADQALIDAANVPVAVRLTTEAMVRGLNEVYELDMTDAHGDPIESGQGRYFCRGWSLQLGPPWEMVHSLTRTIDFATAPFVEN